MDYIKECLNKFGTKYIFKESFKKGGRIKIKYICKIHGEREQTFKSFINCGCLRCHKTLSIDEFLKRAVNLHGDRFDYRNVKYINAVTKIEIICKIHGSFRQTPNGHLSSKIGCFYCINKIKTTEDFIKICSEKFNNKYDYSLSIYKGRKERIDIICPIHGKFIQKASEHLDGGGCRRCTYNIDTTLDFIKKAKNIHGDKYNYNNVVYTKSSDKIEIICHEHGSFFQKAGNHINKKYGCPLCFSKISKLEKQWLDILMVPKRQHKIGNFYVDGYNPETNTVYEFYGDFWHGNPKIYDKNKINEKNGNSFGELYQRTIKREEYLKSLGYNLCTLWESDYLYIDSKLLPR